MVGSSGTMRLNFLLLLLLPVTVRSNFFDSFESNLSPLEYGNHTTNEDVFTLLSSEPNAAIQETSPNIPRDLAVFGGLVRRQRRQCPPGTISCGDGVWCNLPGNFCCPADRSVSCPIGHTCCPNRGGCARPGHACCPGTRYSCPVGNTCCPGGGACAPPGGGTCCGQFSCTAAEKCCGGTHCAPKTATCCGTGHCETPGSSCCNGLGCANPGFVCCPGSARTACPTGQTCCTDQLGHYCGRKGCLPTLKFPNVRGVTDEAADNICAGLKAYFAKNGHVEFSWNGPGRANRRITRRNRRRSGCGGGLSCPAGYNCDEFPLASTAEGGRGATIRCIPEWLNGFYGYFWNIWRMQQVASTAGFRKGSKFRIIIDNCDFTTFPRRSELLDERAVNDLVLSSNGDVTVLDGSVIGDGTDGNNVVMIPLTKDTGNPGKYTLEYALQGETISSGWIMDEDGEIYETLGELKSGASNTTGFEIEDADDYSPIYFYGWTKATEVKIDISVKEPPPPSSTPSAKPTVSESEGSPAPTNSPSAAGTVKVSLGLVVGICTAISVYMMGCGGL